MDQPLALLEPADEQDVERPVAQLLVRLGLGESLEVDAVRDDLVLAGEVAADEVARRAGDGDPPVEPLGQPPGESLPDPVRGREAAEGVEGGDVDRPRLVEHGRRQERHERLVEVEDVEVVRLEHLARLVLEPQPERHATDAAVGRRRPAGAEADDVALALALAAVLAT